MSGLQYLSTTKNIYEKKCSTGVWQMDSPPTYWNGTRAVAFVTYLVKGVEKQAKVIINGYYQSSHN